MLTAAGELADRIHPDDDVVIVDGMLDVTVLVAMLKARDNSSCPPLLVYMHENQLPTGTPFTSQDRDKQKNTHWHYGIAHWRSLMVADGFVFNSSTHLEQFRTAIPKLINQQCPRDTVEWHLNKAKELLRDKCTVLRYGLDLDELLPITQEEATAKRQKVGTIPSVLWNARLEEDKNPAAFIDLMHHQSSRG